MQKLCNKPTFALQQYRRVFVALDNTDDAREQSRQIAEALVANRVDLRVGHNCSKGAVSQF